MKIKAFFSNERIIHSRHMQPGKKLFSYTTSGGKRYIRIAFTNKIKYAGTMPVTDILFEDITGIRVMPSPFKKWLYSLAGKKPKAIFYHFTDLKDSKWLTNN